MNMRKMFSEIYDAIIIGAGPSGLLSAYYLTKMKRKVLIIDKGKLLQERIENQEEDVSMGIGGCGLFSDGKFSYFPSATELWKLDSEDDIKESYKEIVNVFAKNEIHLKSLESISYDNRENEKKDNYEKKYESEYVDIKKRINLINYICEFIGYNNILDNKEVALVRKNNSCYEVVINNSDVILKSNTVIYAAGRYGSYNFKKIFNSDEVSFKKYEVGIRVECKSEEFKPYSNPQTDYKYIKTISPGVQVRTFCCCRDGKVIKSRFGNFESFNGSSDIKGTGKSNIGINLRISNENVDKKLLNEVTNIVAGKHSIFQLPLKDFLNMKKTLLGKNIDPIIKQFIVEILGEYSDNSSFIYGPTIEGVGFYPKFEDKKLKLHNEAVWVSGDSSGMFRGLAAALISGVFVGKSVETFLVNNENRMIKQLNIKSSSTKDMQLIFTAQSKVYFYCRDVVCEYVLKNECLPINPFRIFDYFLGDRVDRNLIRRGNNKLIRTCSELWVFGPISDGVLFEIALARQLRIPIKFYSIGTKVEEIYRIDYDDISFEPEVHAKQIKKDDLIRFIKGGIVSFPYDKKGYNMQIELDLGELE